MRMYSQSTDLIEIVRDSCEDDFFFYQYIIVLMYVTVLLATMKGRMLHKIRMMKNFCDEFDIKVNELRTMFFF